MHLLLSTFCLKLALILHKVTCTQQGLGQDLGGRAQAPPVQHVWSLEFEPQHCWVCIRKILM